MFLSQRTAYRRPRMVVEDERKRRSIADQRVRLGIILAGMAGAVVAASALPANGESGAATSAAAARSLNGPIVFARVLNAGWRIFSFSGGRTNLVVGARDELAPVVSVDGRTLAFEQCLPTDSFAPECAIATAPVSGGKPVRLTDEFAEGLAYNPRWSPVPGVFGFEVPTGFSTGGSPDDCCLKIAVLDRSGIRVVGSTGGYEGWTWSPDGALLAYSFMETGAIEIVDAARSCRDPYPFCPEPPAEPLAVGVNPDWSPAGDRIVFDGRGGLFTIRPDGTGKQQLTRGRDVAPRWSPDGRWIAFVRLSLKSEISSVDVVAADGSRLRRLWRGPVHRGALAAPTVAWSPDSRFLVWSGGGIGELWSKVFIAPIDKDGAARSLGDGARPAWGRPRCSALGTMEGERLVGTTRADVVCGFGGDDTLQPGPGRDVAFGDAGDDTFLLRDGEADAVACGGGRDIVYADPIDATTHDCERVLRG